MNGEDVANLALAVVIGGLTFGTAWYLWHIANPEQRRYVADYLIRVGPCVGSCARKQLY